MSNQEISNLFVQLGGDESVQIFSELTRVKRRANARLGSGINRRAVRKIILKLEAEKRR